MKNGTISGLLTVALAAGSIVTAPPRARADQHGDCQRRVEKAEDHYRKESHEHGKHSRQAQEARTKLNETWDRCWSTTHAWYDPHRHEWRTDRDWDRNYDWDRDGDHDRDDR
jgi:hypothetical protein